MKYINVNLFRLVSHEFWRAMRAWGSDIESKQLIERLAAERQKALQLGLRGFFIGLAGSLWISNARINNDVTLSLFTLSLTIPVIYVSFAISAITFGAITSFLSYMHLNDFLSLAVRKHYRFENSVAFVAPLDGSSAWSIASMLQFRFFKSDFAHKSMGFMTLFAILLPMIIALLFVDAVVLAISLSTIANEYRSLLKVVIAFFSILLVCYPWIFIILLMVPFSFSNNLQFVRWNFLYARVYRKNAMFHPQMNRWLNK